MNPFEIYIHGTPRGHQICGGRTNHDYISTFYNHDSQAKEKVVLRADICAGDSFYTYIRRQDVYDVEGRPEAFFALTVSFHKSYCTNVYKLFQLFEAVYSQICVGSILQQSENIERFLVADFTAARSGADATVDKIQAAFNQKIVELISPCLLPLSWADTFDKARKTVSLMDVDSPFFFEYFKKYTVVISPSKQSVAKAYAACSAERNELAAQRKALSEANSRLQSEVAALKDENKTIAHQLRTLISASEKKRDSSVEKLQNELSQAIKERDVLREKVEGAKSSVELIDKPFQQLVRLLAGRFPEARSERSEENIGAVPAAVKASCGPLWRDWLNSALLGLVLAISFIILLVVLKNPDKPQTKSDLAAAKEVVAQKAGETEEDAAVELLADHYDSWEDCFVDIRGGGEQLDLKKEYRLSVRKGMSGPKANIPAGSWNVVVGEGQTIDTESVLRLENPRFRGERVTIEYVVNDNPVISRICYVK